MNRLGKVQFPLALIAVASAFIVLLISGCSNTFQQTAKEGSDLRDHCAWHAQLCTPEGTKLSPFGHEYTEAQLDLRCQRLDEDAELWEYSCANYLP